MIYTADDEKLVHFIFHKYFKKYLRFKDDMLQAGRLQLISNINKFNTTRNISIITYKSLLIKTGMATFIRDYFHVFRKQNALNTQILDIDLPRYGELNNITLAEIIADDKINLDSNLNLEYINLTIQKVLKKMNKSDKFNQIILEYIKDNNQVRVAKKLNVVRQHVNHCVNIFRDKLKDTLIKEEYL